jgi:ElaB/YqjD/DUF883 family membrane-anchored ribosome-binding protein
MSDGNGAAARAKEKIGEAAHKARDATQQAVDAAATKGSELLEVSGIANQTRKHPYAMVGAAFGLGYVAGGGLFSPTTMRVLELGVKLLALPPVRDKLLDIAEAAVDAALAQTDSFAAKKQ